MRLLVALLLVPMIAGRYAQRSSSGGGQAAFSGERQVDAGDVLLPPGYAIEAVATGLTYPSNVTFDEAGTPYVVEAGYSYGEDWTVPRLLRVEGGGATSVIAEGTDNGPWTGAAFANGMFYIAEGGERHGGRILAIAPGGWSQPPLIENLPSMGDHHTNGVVLGPDGWLYFGQGTATNSGIVGPDNADFGWLKRHPAFHDIPCEDIRPATIAFTSEDALDQGRGTVTTGPFTAYGEVPLFETIRGQVPCNGAILRLSPKGGPVELVAWGFRNPYGLAFAPDGTLYVTDNQYDERGSRPVFGTGDLLWRVEKGSWYGWPDFHGTLPLDRSRFAQPGTKDVPKLLLAEHPAQPPRPVAVLPVHAAATGFDISRSPEFGYAGQAFIAEFGDQAPVVGKVLAPVGFRVVRVDLETGVIEDFAVNRGKINGPASWQGSRGLERPVAARFSPDGRALYVVDFGVMTMTEQGAVPHRGTGVLWRITRAGG